MFTIFPLCPRNKISVWYHNNNYYNWQIFKGSGILVVIIYRFNQIFIYPCIFTNIHHHPTISCLPLMYHLCHFVMGLHTQAIFNVLSVSIKNSLKSSRVGGQNWLKKLKSLFSKHSLDVLIMVRLNGAARRADIMLVSTLSFNRHLDQDN